MSDCNEDTVAVSERSLLSVQMHGPRRLGSRIWCAKISHRDEHRTNDHQSQTYMRPGKHRGWLIIRDNAIVALASMPISYLHKWCGIAQGQTTKKHQ